MELKTYLRIIFKYWWIVVPVFAITLLATIFLTLRQTQMYTSTATFVVTPSDAFEDARSFASGLDTLSRRAEIASTYGEVASSRTVKNAALDTLNLSPEERKNLSIKGTVLSGTNIFKITVEAPDPVVARDVANAIGTETIEFAQSLYEPYVLRPLDAATVRRKPTRPTPQTNILLGGVFGLVLGAGLAFLADYLKTPLETMISVNVLDPEIGVYSKDYFMQRLGVEITRAQRHSYPLSIALVNVDQMGLIRGTRSPQAQSEILRKTAVKLRQYLREEDLVAYFGEATFALMLPDVRQESAESTIETLQTRIAWAPIELERTGAKVNLTTSAGVASLDSDALQRDDLIMLADQAMRRGGVVQSSQVLPAVEDRVSLGEPAAQS